MLQAGNGDALKVFFKASDDDEFSMEFIKMEIPVIDYVRDQADAEFHIIATAQNTGTQGKVYSFYLIGKQDFEGKSDTVSYTSSPDDTREKIYEGQVSALKMGLLPYILQTPQVRRIKISFADGEPAQPTGDPWKSWVFSLYAGADANGEKTRNYVNIWCGFSIEKVTPEWKFELVTDFGNQLQRFEIEEEVISRNTARIGEMILAKSLGERWSAGVQGFLGAFSFYNYRLKSNLFPVIEYNLFPYAESARRQVQLETQYSFHANISFRYTFGSIYDRVVNPRFDRLERW
jgi:hypothetical protein